MLSRADSSKNAHDSSTRIQFFNIESDESGTWFWHFERINRACYPQMGGSSG